MNTHQHAVKPIVRITSEPQIIAADEPAFFVISVTENYKNIPLEEVHTMKMHLLLVNDELTWFDHIHPEEQADGTYYVSETFPSSGKYLLFMDYKPIDHPAAIAKHTIEVAGKYLYKRSESDTKLASVIDGYTVILVNGKDLKTNAKQACNFQLKKTASFLKKKICNLILEPMRIL